MTTIWKFQLPRHPGSFIREMPKAFVLSVQMQADQPVMWAAVNPNAPMRTHYFITVGTGFQFESTLNDRFIGTYQDGPFVWHFYDRGESVV